ncbi:hypothetical protein Pint_27079 [Pistacia integerrima]|uniref:Uncharacterized protein n=1 Tax=Pistacia integerrima TaxID=434235 RepID=A0ACC0YQE8_9ROSI|nr:hypothetical protein Pint_27079 [Pistacia integerrima]
MQIDNYYGSTTIVAGPNLNGHGIQDLQCHHLHKLNNPETMMPSSRKERQQMGLLQEVRVLVIQSCRGRSGLLAITFTLLKAKLQSKGLSSFKKSFRWIKDVF